MQAAAFKEKDCIIPGTGTACLSLVKDLPWNFDLASNKKNDLSDILYTSYATIGKQAVKIRLRLEIIAFANKEEVGEELRERYSTADPDMGLSYAWDFIADHNLHLYHLHADCILSEANFVSIADALTEILEPTDLFQNNNQSAFLCRCGGPCRMLTPR